MNEASAHGENAFRAEMEYRKQLDESQRAFIRDELAVTPEQLLQRYEHLEPLSTVSRFCMMVARPDARRAIEFEGEYARLIVTAAARGMTPEQLREEMERRGIWRDPMYHCAEVNQLGYLAKMARSDPILAEAFRRTLQETHPNKTREELTRFMFARGTGSEPDAQDH